MKRGLFVVFEGVEKGGKKTQSLMLAEALKQITGKEPTFIHFPDKSTPTGKLIERYANGDLKIGLREAHLLYTANRWERQNEISEALAAGISVVADRYSYSNIVYTAAAMYPFSNADWAWCRQVEEGLLQPDLIFCLAPTDFHEITAREGFGQRATENPSFQTQVLRNYARLCKEMEAESKQKDSETDDEKKQKPKLWNWIQATGQSVDDIHNCIMTIIDPIL